MNEKHKFHTTCFLLISYLRLWSINKPYWSNFGGNRLTKYIFLNRANINESSNVSSKYVHTHIVYNNKQ